MYSRFDRMIIDTDEFISNMYFLIKTVIKNGLKRVPIPKRFPPESQRNVSFHFKDLENKYQFLFSLV